MGALNHWLLVLVCICCCHLGSRQPAANAQRSLNHWKRDLEYRLNLYLNQRDSIRNIIESSILRPTIGTDRLHLATSIRSNGNVRFSDLIIPAGSLTLSSHVAQPTVQLLIDKTQSFINSKLNDLNQIRNQIDQVDRQLLDPSQSYIYKGVRGAAQPAFNYTNRIQGRRIFKQAQFVNVANSANVLLRLINNTDVDRVINETYMKNPQFGLLDAQGRLFFEGRKTFWNTSFLGPLKSGCCDRLKPLHTNRMMLRSARQDVLAPILIHSRDSPTSPATTGVRVERLRTDRLLNRHLTLTQPPATYQQQQRLPPNDNGLLVSPPENLIRLPSLVQIRPPFDQPEILKTLVFREPIHVDEAYLSNSILDGRLVIGLSAGDAPGNQLDLAHDNYLLKYFPVPKGVDSSPSPALFTQYVKQPVQVTSSAHFLANLNGSSVNHIENFNQFINEQLVRLDRPTIVRGPIQFNALPSLLNNNNLAGGPSRQPQSVLVMQVDRGLEVGSVNGMRFPRDIVLLPTKGNHPQNHNQSLKPFDLIHVRGPRQFTNANIFHQLLQVSGLANGLKLPRDVIPLHLNDFIHSVGYSNLVFVDGISAQHMTIQSGQFDDIVLKNVHGDAQSLIMRSAIAAQPDGSLLIRAPLRVNNLNLIRRNNAPPNHGQLNGVRPQEITELAAGWRGYNASSMYPPTADGQQAAFSGRKTFLAPIEASDCIFHDINSITNWTSHLIRIDRPNTVQTIHTKLAFKPLTAMPPAAGAAPSPPPRPTSINANRFDVEFYPDDSPANYQNNWNFSPEFYIMHQALLRAATNSSSGGRYRVLNQVNVIPPLSAAAKSAPLVNGIPLHEIVTKDLPMTFSERFTMVGKVELSSGSSLRANRIQSNYPLDSMDLVQFEKYRIPLTGLTGPIQLNNLVLGPDNRASFVQLRLLNGHSFNEFAQSIMSLTRPQTIDSTLVFNSPAEMRGFVRTSSGLNGIKNFARFASNLKQAKYSFENGLQCNTLVIA